MNGAVACLCAPSNVLCYAEKCDPPTPPHTFLKWRFLADFKKYTHNPPEMMTYLHMETKLAENAEKCQNPQSWHILNVPERYSSPILILYKFLAVPNLVEHPYPQHRALSCCTQCQNIMP